MSGDEPVVVKCPLCGLKYDSAQCETACRRCPLRRSCTMAKCPNCGYETPALPPLER